MPEFSMPPCLRHFFKGHRWWCRACDRETESQFKQVAEAWWNSVGVVTELSKMNVVLMEAVDTPAYRDCLLGARPTVCYASGVAGMCRLRKYHPGEHQFR